MSGAVASSSATSKASSSRWLFGPVPDLLLGCGGLYLLVFVLLAGASETLTSVVPPGMMPLLVLVTSIPHYGATLLRVYGDDGEIRRYRILAVWISLLVYAWLAVSVYDATVGSWMITLYLTWSPWHYSGQNYGIALMFLGRRGVSVSPEAKRWLYATFVFSFALAFLGIHTVGSVDSYAPGAATSDAYRTIRLGVPATVSAWLLLVAIVGYGASLFVCATSLLRVAALRDLAPAAALVALQGLWFSLPVLARATGFLGGLAPFGGSDSFREYAFLWVAIGHAVQYLWVTSYYAMRQESGAGHARYLFKAVAAGGAIFGLPLLFLGPDVLGGRGYDAGLALLIASAVNLHHFILDGAIWKLRDGRIAKVLLRPVEPMSAPTAPRAGALGRHLRWALLALGVVYAGTFAFATVEYEYGVRRAGDAEDFERMRTAASRLRWVGRDNALLRHNLAIAELRAGDLEAAREQVERSLRLDDTARSRVLLGMVHQQASEWQSAADAYQRALELDPEYLPALQRLARVWLELGDRPRARETLERAIELAPERADLRQRLSELDQAGSASRGGDGGGDAGASPRYSSSR